MIALREVHCVALGVPQASGVTTLGEGFAVVDDERGLFRVTADGEATALLDRTASASLRDLEGVCRVPGGALLVVSERSGQVTRVQLDDASFDVLGALEEIGSTRNKGWEGITFLEAAWGGPWLLACHESKPKRIGVFSPHTLETEAILRLPKKTKKALDDLSDLTVDPETGHLLVLSDASSCIAELSLVDGELTHLGVTPLDVGKREKPEGLTFDAAGALWLVTDEDPHLRRYEVSRG